jgi:hypothetical protein
MPENDARTPNGLPCWIAGQELAALIREQARGSYQAGVANHLIQYGYVIGYRATGSMLKGNARKYNGKYATSVRNLMNRIEEKLPGTLCIEKGPVGPKGGFGYRLVI